MNTLSAIVILFFNHSLGFVADTLELFREKRIKHERASESVQERNPKSSQ